MPMSAMVGKGGERLRQLEFASKSTIRDCSWITAPNPAETARSSTDRVHVVDCSDRTSEIPREDRSPMSTAIWEQIFAGRRGNEPRLAAGLCGIDGRRARLRPCDCGARSVGRGGRSGRSRSRGLEIPKTLQKRYGHALGSRRRLAIKKRGFARRGAAYNFDKRGTHLAQNDLFTTADHCRIMCKTARGAHNWGATVGAPQRGVTPRRVRTLPSVSGALSERGYSASRLCPFAEAAQECPTPMRHYQDGPRNRDMTAAAAQLVRSQRCLRGREATSTPTAAVQIFDA